MGILQFYKFTNFTNSVCNMLQTEVCYGRGPLFLQQQRQEELSEQHNNREDRDRNYVSWKWRKEWGI